ncbi:hypothetical protein B0O99DRAFT_701615 [Bisporella sp. PMI_857]|nr:hypothetical protein B0O99DRAFT_701615 [Bisporella sp. PMI_857]
MHVIPCAHNKCHYRQQRTDDIAVHKSLIGSVRVTGRSSQASTPRTDSSLSGKYCGRTTSSSSGTATLRVDSRLGTRLIISTPTPLPTDKNAHDGQPSKPDTPELDRTIDCIACEEAVDIVTIFERLCPVPAPKPSLTEEFHRRDMPKYFPSANLLFALPAKVRYIIYSYCFKDERRKISLSPRFATKAVFPEDYFASPWDVLEPVSGALGAFEALRVDLMTYFWSQNQFHITLSAFTGPKICPLSQIWLVKYLDIVQDLAIEIDLTRFGGGVQKHASSFGHNYTKLESSVAAIVEGLLTRQGRLPMKQRYSGLRPLAGPAGADESYGPRMPYVPDSALRLCDVISRLRGRLKQCRLTGFPQEYTFELLNNIYSGANGSIIYTFPSRSAWSAVFFEANNSDGANPPPHLSFLNDSQVAEQTQNPTYQCFEEFCKHELSLRPLCRTLVHEEINTTVAKEGQRYRSSNNTKRSTESNSFVVSKDPVLPPVTPTQDSSPEYAISTPRTSAEHTSKASPNTMNRMNEQDPAFRRALEGLSQSSLGSGGGANTRVGSELPSRPLSLKSKLHIRAHTGANELRKTQDHDPVGRRHNSLFGRLLRRST